MLKDCACSDLETVWLIKTAWDWVKLIETVMGILASIADDEKTLADWNDHERECDAIDLVKVQRCTKTAQNEHHGFRRRTSPESAQTTQETAFHLAHVWIFSRRTTFPSIENTTANTRSYHKKGFRADERVSNSRRAVETADQVDKCRLVDKVEDKWALRLRWYNRSARYCNTKLKSVSPWISERRSRNWYAY